ncbi:MAG: hypothetical protein Q7T61_20370 [Caulobacter sp.]|nr:hypothetical protein [Caulobacter sp.]
MGGKVVSLCPIPESEPGNWSDLQLRAGSSSWARLEGVTATRLADGRIRVEARVAAWNVSSMQTSFELGVGKGYELKAWMRRDDPGAAPDDHDLLTCQAKRLTMVSEGAFDDATTLLLRGGLNDRSYAEPWDISAVIAAARASAPPPAPAPTPDPPAGDEADIPPPAIPAPPASPGTGGPSLPSQEGSGAGVPAALRSWSNYGIWDFRVEELKPGPDGDWQAVVRVRDAAIYRVGLSTDGVKLWLFDEDGRSVENNDVLYRASVSGSANQLEGIPQTMWMEKGDEVRVRLLIHGSKGFKPVRLRLGSGDRETLSRTWPMP